MSVPKQEGPKGYLQPLVSVVMPVRDQERVLRQTLESVLSQTLRNFELVLVDDGSADGSSAIEREFAKRDPRVRLFLRAAEGAGPARNYGLGEAAGRYVAFLDSDDLFHPDMLLDMASALEATGADICICETDVFHGDGSRPRPYSRHGRHPEGLYRRHALGRETFQVGGLMAWNKMYRREFLARTGTLFQDVRRNNDCYFATKTMWDADSVYLLKRPLVNYRRGLGTSIQDRRLNYPYDALEVAEKVLGGIDDPEAFSASEAASLRLAYAYIVLPAVRDVIASGAYDERFHEAVAAALRQWDSLGAPRTLAELRVVPKMALLRHATHDKVLWAHARWKRKTHSHTLPEKLDFAARIVLAIALSNLSKKAGWNRSSESRKIM